MSYIYENRLQSRDFPDCCGARIYAHFPHPHFYAPGDQKQAIKDVKDFLAARDPSKSSIFGEYAFPLVILNENQEKYLGTTIKKAGFELLRQKKNPNSALDLFLYCRDH